MAVKEERIGDFQIEQIRLTPVRVSSRSDDAACLLSLIFLLESYLCKCVNSDRYRLFIDWFSRVAR